MEDKKAFSRKKAQGKQKEIGTFVVMEYVFPSKC